MAQNQNQVGTFHLGQAGPSTHSFTFGHKTTPNNPKVRYAHSTFLPSFCTSLGAVSKSPTSLFPWEIGHAAGKLIGSDRASFRLLGNDLQLTATGGLWAQRDCHEEFTKQNPKQNTQGPRLSPSKGRIRQGEWMGQGVGRKWG